MNINSLFVNILLGVLLLGGNGYAQSSSITVPETSVYTESAPDISVSYQQPVFIIKLK